MTAAFRQHYRLERLEPEWPNRMKARRAANAFLGPAKTHLFLQEQISCSYYSRSEQQTSENRSVMLTVKPNYISSTPMMMFQGHSHRGALVSHIVSGSQAVYDSLFLVNRSDANQYCLIISLEADAPDKPLNLVIYNEKGRLVLPQTAPPITRQTFLAAAFFAVEKLLHDRMQTPLVPQGKPLITEKPLQDFYPDAKQRLQLHYTFAHKWLPAYVHSDPIRFFGYLQRGENQPNHFIQSRWQMMERDLGLASPPPAANWIIRRVSDLQMFLDNSSSYPLAIVEMPKPEFITHTWYVGIALGPEAHQAAPRPTQSERIFTLERVQDTLDQGVLCEWTFEKNQLSHRNYGLLVPTNREQFTKAILAQSLQTSPLRAITHFRLG